MALPLLHFLVCIFDHYDRCIHHRCDGDSNAAQAHDIRSDPKVIHADERYYDRHREGEDNDEGTRQMKQEYDADRAHGQREFDYLFFKGRDRIMNEVRPVISDNNLYPLWQAWLDIILKFLLYAFDDIQHILPEPHDDDASSHFAFAVKLSNTSPNFRPELNAGNVPD